MRRRKKSIVFPIIAIILFLVAGGCLAYSIYYYLQYKASQSLYEDIVDKAVVIPNEIPKEETEYVPPVIVTYPYMEIDYDELMSINNDFVGMLYIPSLDIFYPIAHSKDNEDYLKTSFSGEKLFAGCIFLDKYASPDFTDNNSFIFGHNMKNGSMFGSLKKVLKEPDIFNNNPYIYIYRKDKILKYRIFSCGLVPAEDKAYEDITSDTEYDDYIIAALNRSVLNSPEDLSFENRPSLLTLSTCSGTGHVKFLLVNAALIGEGNRPVYYTEAE